MLSNTGTCTDSSPTVSLELVRTFLLNFPCSFYFLSILSLLHIGAFPRRVLLSIPILSPTLPHQCSQVLLSPNFFTLRSCVSISMNFPTYAHTSARAHLACGERGGATGSHESQRRRHQIHAASIVHTTTSTIASTNLCLVSEEVDVMTRMRCAVVEAVRRHLKHTILSLKITVLCFLF